MVSTNIERIDTPALDYCSSTRYRVPAAARGAVRPAPPTGGAGASVRCSASASAVIVGVQYCVHASTTIVMGLSAGLGLGLAAACIIVPLVAGHGAMVTPRSRNSIDYDENVSHFPASGGGDNWAWCTNMTGAPCNNGQAAYWYSQGCFIGCPECDHKSGRRQTDLCGKGFVGMLPDYAIAVNRNVERNGPLDIYRHNPWRAPGHAPVADACKPQLLHSPPPPAQPAYLHALPRCLRQAASRVAHRGRWMRRKKAGTSTRPTRVTVCGERTFLRCRRERCGKLGAPPKWHGMCAL